MVMCIEANHLSDINSPFRHIGIQIVSFELCFVIFAVSLCLFRLKFTLSWDIVPYLAH